MDTACTLQIFVDATWQDAAVLDLTGEVDLGAAAATYLSIFLTMQFVIGNAMIPQPCLSMCQSIWKAMQKTAGRHSWPICYRTVMAASNC